MADLWFVIVCAMLTTFVVLDGFDLGAGALLYALARTEEERKTVHAAVGPFWDGNEVWLLASGGSLMVSFPAALAAGLSGFYLAIFLLVWLLVGRAMAIELRAHLPHPLFSSLFDFGFVACSAGVAIVLGAALGNVVRGVPLDDGSFALPLFASGAPGEVGLLDAFTVPAGLFAALVCAGHGAAFVAWRAGGGVRGRARRLVRWLVPAIAVAWAPMLALTRARAPHAWDALTHRPLAIAFALAAAACLVAVRALSARDRDRGAFLASAGFVATLMGSVFASHHPFLLRHSPTTGAASDRTVLDLTVASTHTEIDSLRTATMWWLVGASLAVTYFVALFRHHARRTRDSA